MALGLWGGGASLRLSFLKIYYLLSAVPLLRRGVDLPTEASHFACFEYQCGVIKPIPVPHALTPKQGGHDANGWRD